jgi:hypothetical protein
MSAASWRDMLALTRPRQWPILSAQLAVGVILSTGGGMTAVAWGPAAGVLAAAWLAWVVLLNGGTLAYNSAYDRDTGPVAYLPRPPRPPARAAGIALAMMMAGAVLGALAVSMVFGRVVGACVMLSVLYSHPASRWKARPGLDLVVNMAGYGAGTTLAGLLAGRAALATPPAPAAPLLVGGFALLFGSLYPLTQIYQVRDDLARGDRTLATALGMRPALGLALVLGAGAGALLAGAAASAAGRLVIAGAMAVWLGHLGWWLVRAGSMDDRDHERGMYRALGAWALVDAAVVAAHLLAA